MGTASTLANYDDRSSDAGLFLDPGSFSSSMFGGDRWNPVKGQSWIADPSTGVGSVSQATVTFWAKMKDGAGNKRASFAVSVMACDAGPGIPPGTGCSELGFA